MASGLFINLPNFTNFSLSSSFAGPLSPLATKELKKRKITDFLFQQRCSSPLLKHPLPYSFQYPPTASPVHYDKLLAVRGSASPMKDWESPQPSPSVSPITSPVPTPKIVRLTPQKPIKRNSPIPRNEDTIEDEPMEPSESKEEGRNVAVIIEAIKTIGGRATGVQISHWICDTYPEEFANRKKLSYIVNAILSSKKHTASFRKDVVVIDGNKRALWSLAGELLEEENAHDLLPEKQDIADVAANSVNSDNDSFGGNIGVPSEDEADTDAGEHSESEQEKPKDPENARDVLKSDILGVHGGSEPFSPLADLPRSRFGGKAPPTDQPSGKFSGKDGYAGLGNVEMPLEDEHDVKSTGFFRERVAKLVNPRYEEVDELYASENSNDMLPTKEDLERPLRRKRYDETDEDDLRFDDQASDDSITTYTEMIEHALRCLGGRGTGVDITSFIDDNYSTVLTNKTKTWRNSVMGCLSANRRNLFSREPLKENSKRYVWKLNDLSDVKNAVNSHKRRRSEAEFIVGSPATDRPEPFRTFEIDSDHGYASPSEFSEEYSGRSAPKKARPMKLEFGSPMKVSTPTGQPAGLASPTTDESQQANYLALIQEAMLDLGGQGTGSDVADVISQRHPELGMNRKKLTYTVNAVLSSKKYSCIFIKDPVVQGGRSLWRLVSGLNSPIKAKPKLK